MEAFVPTPKIKGNVSLNFLSRAQNGRLHFASFLIYIFIHKLEWGIERRCSAQTAKAPKQRWWSTTAAFRWPQRWRPPARLYHYKLKKTKLEK